MNGGTLGEVSGEKIHKVIDLAISLGIPLIGINDGGGARVQEGVVALHYYGGIFRRNVAASGVVPQISVIMGSCAGGAVYSPAITDFVFMVQGTSQMFITGPDVVKTVTGEDVTQEELGGALTHATKSGVASFVAPDEKACLDQVRELLAYLPSNNLWGNLRLCRLPTAPTTTSADAHRVGTRISHQPYDVKQLLRAVLDGGELFEYHALWALNLVCGFGRIGGQVVGVVANQPQVLAGVLDIDASEKGARFVRTCDCFNIPIVTFVDVPGFMPGTDQDTGAFPARSQVALCLLRGERAENPADSAQSLRGRVRHHVLQVARRRPRLRLAGRRTGRHRAESAVDLLFAPELAGATAERRAELVQLYRDANTSPSSRPTAGTSTTSSTRPRPARVLRQGLEMLAGKRQEVPARKHGNIPL